MSRRSRIGAALAAGLLLAACTAAAQTPRAADAPLRIGLALSGGGARGAAHVGVLKVLEELRVPVHCVAGTSMGAVVGGAFAAGNTPADMERLIEATDWSEVFTDRPPRGEVAARRKLDDYRPLFAPEFGFNRGEFQLPKGVVAGVTIEGFLRHLAAPALGRNDFGTLPVPFRAVASDIETGQAVVMTRGNLMQAMRASMAVPGAVAPVEVDGRLLVDGGIANNLPIDVVRQMCADVVIAVNISTPTLKRSEITSALGVVEQLINLLGKDAVDRQLATLGARDVLIQPALGDISAGSFERQLEAVRIGEAAARALAEPLRRYSVSPEAYAEFKLRQAAARDVATRIDEIRFEGTQRTQPARLASLMDTKPGDPVSVDRLNADLRRLYGIGDFEAVDYRIDADAQRSALTVSLREKSTGPNYVRFGLGMNSDFHGESGFNLLVSHRRTWLNASGAEWITEAQIGQTNVLFSELHQPLGASGDYFAAAYGQVGQTTRGVYDGDTRLAEYEVREARAGVDLGRTLGTWGEARVGLAYRRVTAGITTGATPYPDVKNEHAGVRLRVIGDRFDTPWFPRSGYRLTGSAFFGTGVGGSQDRYRKAEATWAGATSVGPHTFSAALALGSNFDTTLPISELYALGGPLRLSGYRNGQFAGQRVALASLRYYRQLYRLPSLLGSGFYAGASAEMGRLDRQLGTGASTGRLWSTSVFLGAETFLGPAFLGVGYGGKGNTTLYLLLGVGVF